MCGCTTCYKYYCSDEQYRLYLQPVYRNDYDVSPVAHFKYVDRVAGCCTNDERMLAEIVPAEEITDDEMALLSFYLILTSGYAKNELGCNFKTVSCLSASPFGVQSTDEILGIHTRYLDEKEAGRAQVISTAKLNNMVPATRDIGGSRQQSMM